ncbi:MAG: hypothetical protein OXG24_01965 [Gammaproteobacteria bacterium]|nr:hypothetical protein [Gammaproteobacteria bacterium]
MMKIESSHTSFGRTVLRALSFGFMFLVLQVGMDCILDSTGFMGGQLTLAQTTPTEDPRPKRTIPTMSAETYEKLAKFNEILMPTDDEGNPLPLEEVGERDLPAAQKILDNLLARYRRLNGNEMAQVHRSYAWLGQEMDDTRLTIEHLTKILDYRESIAYVLEEQTLNNLSKMHFTLEEYEEALDFAMQYMDLSITEGPNDYVYVSQIYIALEDFQNTKIWIKLAISTAEEQMKPVKEYWYQILISSVSVLEEWDEVLEVNKICVVKWPKHAYWLGMAQAYMQLGHEDKALYTLECAHTAGMLESDKDFTNFASMLALAGAPIRAARVLEEGFDIEIVKQDSKMLKWLAQYYQISLESDLAIKNYIRSADDAEDGELWARVAQLHNETGDFEECIEAVETALDLGVERRVNRLWLTKGSCQFSAENYEAAKVTFTDLQRVLRRSDDDGDDALLVITRSYLKSVENELERIRHEKAVRDAEIAYEEEKRKRS